MTKARAERERNRRAKGPEPFTPLPPNTEGLEQLKGFRVEWDDGVTGRVEGTALFVRTPGFGTARAKLELLTLDDVAAILLEEQRIFARTRVSPAKVLGDAAARALRRGMVRVRGRGRGGATRSC